LVVVIMDIGAVVDGSCSTCSVANNPFAVANSLEVGVKTIADEVELTSAGEAEVKETVVGITITVGVVFTLQTLTGPTTQFRHAIRKCRALFAEFLEWSTQLTLTTRTRAALRRLRTGMAID